MPYSSSHPLGLKRYLSVVMRYSPSFSCAGGKYLLFVKQHGVNEEALEIRTTTPAWLSLDFFFWGCVSLTCFKFIEELSDTYAVFIMNSVNGRELTQYGIRKYILPLVYLYTITTKRSWFGHYLYLYHGSDLFSIVTSLLAYLHNGSKVGIVGGATIKS